MPEFNHSAPPSSPSNGVPAGTILSASPSALEPREPALTFAPALLGDSQVALRQRIESIAATRPGVQGLPTVPLWVDTLHGLYDALPKAALGTPDSKDIDLPLESTSDFLLLDFHRLLLFRAPTTSGASLCSAIWGLVDGYPLTPFRRWHRQAMESPYRFLYSLDALEILPLAWSALGPDQIVEVSLSTGEVEVSPLARHPWDRPGGPRAESPKQAESSEPQGSVVQGSPTAAPPLPSGFRRPDEAQGEPLYAGSSLRTHGLPSAEGFQSSAVGPVRYQRTLHSCASLPISHATLAWEEAERQVTCFGKSPLAEVARKTSIFESLERYQVAFRVPSDANAMIQGSRRQLEARGLPHIDPEDLLYGRAPGCPDDVLLPYDQDVPMLWSWVHPALAKEGSGAEGGAVLAPAQELWFNTFMLDGETLVTRPSTNGCALGGSPEEAAIFALLEAVERDAYMTTWYLRRRVRKIDPDSIDDEDFQLLRHRWEHGYPNYSFHLFDITHDLGIPVIAGVAVRESGVGPKCYHSASCRLDVVEACTTALEDLMGFEIEIRDESWQRHRELLADPFKIQQPGDHYGLYTLDEPFHQQAFLGFDAEPSLTPQDIQQAAALPAQSRYDLREVLHALAQRVEDVGGQLYLKDLTHSSFAERGLHCAKVVTPGLYPIWFGARARRFRVTERLRQLAQRYLGQVPADDEYNLATHPFA